MINKILSATLIGFLTFAFALHGIEKNLSIKEPSQDISSLLEPIIKQYDIPGIVALVLKNGKVEATGAAGVKRRSSSDRVTIDDLFHIGSDTKSMTATLAALFVEKGLIRWDTKVTDLFPELSSKINPAYQNLTLDQLLTHQSGLAANIDFESIQKTSGKDLVQARQLALEKILSQPSEIKPGNFLYSNSGFVIAGHMLEKIAGKPWEDLIFKELFTPLHMETAGFGAPRDTKDHRQPWGHNQESKEVAPTDLNADNPAIMGPAGTVHLTILDWAKYINLHLAGEHGDTDLLKQSSFQKLHKPVEGSSVPYAMGWLIENQSWANGKVLTHAGSNELWYAKVWIAPSRNFAILVAMNIGGDKAAKAANAVGLALVKKFLGITDLQAVDSSK